MSSKQTAAPSLLPFCMHRALLMLGSNHSDFLRRTQLWISHNCCWMLCNYCWISNYYLDMEAVLLDMMKLLLGIRHLLPVVHMDSGGTSKGKH